MTGYFGFIGRIQISLKVAIKGSILKSQGAYEKMLANAYYIFQLEKQ